MPQLFHVMLAGRAVDFINYQNDIWFLKLHATPMREASISALRLNGVALGVRLPGENRDLRVINPSERTSRRRLIAAVQTNCVVRFGPAEPIAPFLLTHVRARSWIDQNLFIARTHHNAQRIRMAVASAPWSEPSRVEDHLIRDGRHYGHTGI